MKKLISLLLGLIASVTLVSCVISPPPEVSKGEELEIVQPAVVEELPEVAIEEEVPNAREDNVNPVTSIPVVSNYYASEQEVEQRNSIGNLSWYSTIEDMWTLQYPSGSTEQGMLVTQLSSELKSKYISSYNDALRLSIFSGDRGKSTNGANVRTELSGMDTYTLQENVSFDFSFYLNLNHLYTKEQYDAANDDNDPDRVLRDHYEKVNLTIGQFETQGYSNGLGRDLPLVMLTIKRGKYQLVVKTENKVYDYTENGQKVKVSKTFDLLPISNNTIYNVHMNINNGVLTVKLSDSNGLSNEVNYVFDSKEFNYTTFQNYFKIGGYYSGSDQSPSNYQSFSDIFITSMGIKEN